MGPVVRVHLGRDAPSFMPSHMSFGALDTLKARNLAIRPRLSASTPLESKRSFATQAGDSNRLEPLPNLCHAHDGRLNVLLPKVDPGNTFDNHGKLKSQTVGPENLGYQKGGS